MDNILENENLVRWVINKYSYYGDYDDLYQVGMMALVKAAKNFKEGNAKFSTYAYDYILGEVTSFIRANQTVKVSRDIIKLNKKIEACREVLYQNLGREPTNLEISLILEVDEEKIDEVKFLMQQPESLDYARSDEEASYYNSIKIVDNNLNSAYLDLKDSLGKLDEDDQKLIYARYYDGYTQSELSTKMGMSQAQVSRKEKKILEKLKVSL